MAGTEKKRATGVWRGQGWTAARRARFIEALGEAGNVRLAARAVGYACTRDAYRLRHADPEFAAAWDQAVATAVNRIESGLVARALAEIEAHGAALERNEGGATLSFEQIMRLLTYYRGAQTKPLRGGPQRRYATREETDAALMRKLDVLEARVRAAQQARGGGAQGVAAGGTGGAGGMGAREPGRRLMARRRDDVAERLALLPVAERLCALRGLDAAKYNELHARWEGFTHGGQAEPPGDWRVWLIRAGRGFGKTRAGAEWISAQARADGSARIALVGATLADARRVMVEGESGLLAVARPGEEPEWHPSLGLLRFKSGAEARIFSAAAPETLRGPAHHFAWCDELGKWSGDRGMDAWSNLMLTMRCGPAPRTLVTTTPRTMPLMRRVMAMAGCEETLGRTRDNPWLAETFVEAMMADFGGTRLERQELDGEMVDEVERALWTRALIEKRRVAEAPELVRVVIGVDPPASVGGDACGIVAVGLGRDRCGYVLEDASVAGASPEGWARAVAACAARHGAERVVAEKNQGGDMVASVLRGADSGLPLQLVHASRGKSARAEPVSLLYEAGKAFHAGAWPDLEAELCGLQIGGGYAGPGRSPDRADACVWAMTALMLGAKGEARVRGL